MGGIKVKFAKSDTGEWNKKYYYAIDMLFECPMVNVILLSYILRKCFLKRNLATIFPLNFKLSSKFQSFNTTNGSIKMLKCS